MSHIRTRFAPSPTGFLHVGSLRTALYNYLFAKKNGGEFILRIEDTDQTRLVPGSEENMINNLLWAGMDYNEGPGKDGLYGPYTQSKRLKLYQKHAEELIKKEAAYHCFCSSERLENVRQRQMALKLPPAYDQHCRNLSKEEVADRLNKNEPFVIRMKVPHEGEMVFEDIVRGKIAIAYKAIDDQVLIKSDGFPTYHLAVVVDDHHMKISHIIRGEEWLPSTPKHILLYQYFGWKLPQFAHLPLLLNPDKSKLSKRQGDVGVDDYKNKGYLSQALINFIALLGWNPGDERELFTLKQLIHEFTLERVGKAGAIFNIEKLRWINQQYILNIAEEEIFAYIAPLFEKKGWILDDSAPIGQYPVQTDTEIKISPEYVKKVIPLLKERAVTLPDFIEQGEYFFITPKIIDATGIERCWSAQAAERIEKLAKLFSILTSFTAQMLEQTVRDYAEQIEISPKKLFPLLRLAVTGATQGPGLFTTMELLGKEETLSRIEFALKKLS